MLILTVRYPAQIDIDPAYPQGKARNSGSFQDGTGTPLEADWLNDIWGFHQALVAAAGITPSGDPDEVGASDLLDAVRSVATTTTSERHLRGLMQMRAVNLDGVTPTTNANMAAIRSASNDTLIVKGGTNGVFRLGDIEVVSLNGVSSGLTSAIAIAHNGTNRYVAVGSGGVGNFYTTNGSTWTAGGSFPGSPSTPQYIEWDGTEFIVAASGETRHSTNAVAWAAPTGDDANQTGLSSTDGLAVLTAGTVLTTAFGEVAATTDHGVSWAAVSTIPTALPPPVASRIVGDASGEVLALVRETTASLIECWASSDGVAWEKRSEFDGGSSDTAYRALMCRTTGLLVFAISGGGAAIVAASVDRGRTWSPLARYAGVDIDTIAVAEGRIFCAAGTRIFATDPLAA